MQDRCDCRLSWRTIYNRAEDLAWRKEYNRQGEEQLVDYLNSYHLDKGYMVTFSFNQKKEIGVQQVEVDSKTIIEAVV